MKLIPVGNSGNGNSRSSLTWLQMCLFLNGGWEVERRKDDVDCNSVIKSEQPLETLFSLLTPHCHKNYKRRNLQIFWISRENDVYGFSEIALRTRLGQTQILPFMLWLLKIITRVNNAYLNQSNVCNCNCNSTLHFFSFGLLFLKIQASKNKTDNERSA